MRRITLDPQILATFHAGQIRVQGSLVSIIAVTNEESILLQERQVVNALRSEQIWPSNVEHCPET